jgi:hypothetical protein
MTARNNNINEEKPQEKHKWKTSRVLPCEKKGKKSAKQIPSGV